MLKSVLRGVFLVSAVAITGFALHTGLTEGDTVFAGSRPNNLGVTEGRLAPPRKTPNCVSSQADPADSEHAIAPIRFSGNPGEAIGILRAVVDGMRRSIVVRQEADYLYCEFKSKLLGYVDDVEFSLSAKDGLIHVRSASRLGRRDYGVNRARVESIRARFAAAQAAPAKT